uniref:Uncharacterized protein n=2 Tax=Oryza TaxID=4527 RepID=Q6H4K9_ORYSJ|nr:hypothetical protein [Oryza sativa Japonica Group]
MAYAHFQDVVDYAVHHALANQSGMLVNTMSTVVKSMLDGTIYNAAQGPIFRQHIGSRENNFIGAIDISSSNIFSANDPDKTAGGGVGSSFENEVTTNVGLPARSQYYPADNSSSSIPTWIFADSTNWHTTADVESTIAFKPG